MPGRKDKKSGDRKKRSQGGGGSDSMAAMFGLAMPTGRSSRSCALSVLYLGAVEVGSIYGSIVSKANGLI